MDITLYSVAKWFLDKEEMSNKKLQKLCWYAYSWYIALSYNPEDKNEFEYLFIDDTPEAWVHGPVFPDLYTDYKHNKYSKTKLSAEITSIETLTFLENVWEVYGKNTGDELESITHQELPWINAREGKAPFDACKNKISVAHILEEYLPRM